MTGDRAPKWWDTADSESLCHDDKDEAIAAVLDRMCIEDLASGSWHLPHTLTICGFAPMKVNAGTPEQLLEHILEILDEEHGNPDDCKVSEPTTAMLVLARALLDVVEREYVSWMCEEVVSESVDVRLWMQENAADYWCDFPGVGDPRVTWIGQQRSDR